MNGKKSPETSFLIIHRVIKLSKPLKYDTSPIIIVAQYKIIEYYRAYYNSLSSDNLQSILHVVRSIHILTDKLSGHYYM